MRQQRHRQKISLRLACTSATPAARIAERETSAIPRWMRTSAALKRSGVASIEAARTPLRFSTSACSDLAAARARGRRLDRPPVLEQVLEIGRAQRPASHAARRRSSGWLGAAG